MTEFKTKYGYGDVVYSENGGTIYVGVVKKLKIEAYNNNFSHIGIRYTLGTHTDGLKTASCDTIVSEKNCFATKQEAGENWLRINNLAVGVRNG